MRALIWFLVFAAIIGGFVIHRQREQSAAQTQATSAAATPRPATSEYNLPKRALDRANEVKRQVAEQRKSNDIP